MGLKLDFQADGFHLFSIGEGIAYGSSTMNFFISGAPVSAFLMNSFATDAATKQHFVEHDGFGFDPAELEKLITPRTRALVVIDPNNPTGATYPVEIRRALVELADRHNFPLLADEVYEARFDLGKAAKVENLVIKKDLAARVAEKVPTMLKFTTHIEDGSLFNTPPTFGIYMIRNVLAHVKEVGGLPAMEHLYDEMPNFAQVLDAASGRALRFRRRRDRQARRCARRPGRLFEAVGPRRGGRQSRARRRRGR